MWVFHLSYPLFAHLFTEQNSSILPMNNSPLSPLSPASFSTSPSKSLRTPATENPWTSTRIHKRNAGSLLSLSAQPSSPTFSSAVTPLIVPTTPRPLPSRMLIPKLNFRVRAWIWSLMKPIPLSDVSPPSIYSIVLPRGFMWLWLSPTPTITTTTDTHFTSTSPSTSQLES